MLWGVGAVAKPHGAGKPVAARRQVSSLQKGTQVCQEISLTVPPFHSEVSKLAKKLTARVGDMHIYTSTTRWPTNTYIFNP